MGWDRLTVTATETRYLPRESGQGQHVAILLASLNGESFIADQLDSIDQQDHMDWSLWVSDDGSGDATLEIVQRFQYAHPDRTIVARRGPGRGSTLNFLSLLHDAGIKADYFALCDQDDVWLPQKLSRAVAVIANAGPLPTLYCGRTIIANRDLSQIGASPEFRRPPEFRNALVQSIAGGNTMVLNAAARELVRNATPQFEPVCHDWWLYQVITGAGGQIIYDPEPLLLYRQHSRNQYGTNTGFSAGRRRFHDMLNGRYKIWNARNHRSLSSVSSFLSPANREILKQFELLLASRGWRAVRHLRRTGLFRQSKAGTLSLALAAFFGRL